MERFRPRSVWKSLFAGFLVLAGAACAGDDTGDDPSSVARILSLEADPASVVEGETTRLTWSTANAVSIRLDADGVLVPLGAFAKEGSVEVAPKASTTYHLEAIGKNGRPTVSAVDVEVRQRNAPIIERFEASAPVVGRGKSVTLSWSVLHAEAVELREVGGRTLSRDAAAEGSFEVTLGRTTSYLLQATSARGTTSQSLTVAVGTPPSLALVASSDSVDHGGDLVLSWTVEKAESIVIRDPAGGVLHEGPGESGATNVSATHPGAYTATAVGAGEATATASIFVSVRPVVEFFTARVQASARPGSEALVEWSVRGADSLEIQNASGLLRTFPGGSGDASLPIGAGGGFTLRAYRGGVVAEAVAHVRVVETPLIRSLTTSGLVTAGRGHTGTATVSWEVDGASTLRMDVSPGGAVDLTDKSPRIGEVDVVFLGPGSITVTASNPAGQTVRVIPSPVDPVPTIRALLAAPSRVGSGERVEIHWETLDAQRVVLEMDGKEMAVDPTNVNGFFTTPILAAPSSYQLRAFNGLGFEVISDPISVEVGPPAITSFRTKDGRSLYPAGSSVEFLWENDGGSSLTLTDEAGAVVCAPSAWAAIRKGGCTVPLPTVQAFKTFTLQITNSSGTDSQALAIGAVTGPIITSFTADRPAMTEGETINFSWTTEPDAEGNVPTLTLKDQNGTIYPLAGANPTADSRRFQIPTWGAYTFTLTATTVVDPPFPVDLPITVHGVPVIGDLSSNPPFAAAEGDAVTFSWTSTHGGSMEILALNRNGTPGAALFSSSTKAVVDAGSTTLQPTIAVPNVRVVVRNPLGAPSQKDFRIGVNPATITSFTANGIQAPAVVNVLQGEEVTIAWQTARATTAHYTEGFVDISQRPGAVHLPFSGSLTTTAIETFNFPAGFAFPYDGGTFTAARIARGGYLSFDLAATGTGTNAVLPSTTANTQRFDMLPFWDLLTNGSIWWELVPGKVDQLIIQWTKMDFSTSAQNPANLNFQVVLMADGNFEFRYGPMIGAGNHAQAASATIATQNRAGTLARVISHDTVQPTGLTGRVYRFRSWNDLVAEASTPVPTPLSGTVTFTPTMDRTYRLEAKNGHSEHVEQFEIRVHPKGELQVWANPAEPLPGQAATLHWQGTNLSAITIEDDAGTILHTATSAELASGSLDLGVLPQGIHTFQIHAVGMVSWNQIHEEFVLSVHPPFSLGSFTATDTFIKLGDPPVTLSWQSSGAVSGTITELPSGVVHTIPVGALASGSLQVSPPNTSTYVLELESHQRYRTSELLIEVRSVWIDDFVSSSSVAHAGVPITLSWDAHPQGTLSLQPPLLHFDQVSSPFEDISAIGTSAFGASLDSGLANVAFPQGFTFPFFGKVYDRIYFAVDGYASFDPGLTTISGNLPIPNGDTANQRVHLPIFWDDLHTGANGKVHTAFLPNPNRFIIQWTGFQRFAPSGNRNWNLNFQIVLFPDGSFEYRYGTMSQPPTGTSSTSDCNPTSCVDEANGSSATIGYQEPFAYTGYQLQYGGASSENHPAFPGGLAHRTFRYQPYAPANGATSVQVAPKESTTYTLCIQDGFWEECRDVFVKVLIDSPHYLVDRESTKPFIDIRTTGTSVSGLTADSGRAGVPTPVNMPFFDTTINMSTIWVDANGWVSFAATQPGTTHFAPTALPRTSSATPAGPLVAAYWDDLGCTITAGAPTPTFHHQQQPIAGQTVTILQWTDAKRCGGEGGITFQIQLWSGGDIVVAFDDIWTDGSVAAFPRYNGSIAWVGLEPANRTQHVTAVYRQPKIEPGKSIYYQRKVPPQP